MKKFIQYSAVIVSMILMGFSAKAQTPTGAYCPAYIQSQTQWCWAASTQMVYWCYKPGSIQQCDAVNVSKNLEMNTGCGSLANSATSACTSPLTFNNPQYMYGCAGSLQSILSNYAIPSTSFASNLSAATLSAAVSARKLVIARWGWNGGGGHFVVVNRYKSGNVYFNNPLSGAVIWSYNAFNTANGAGTWTHTLRMNNASVYGSTLYRESNETVKTELPTTLELNMYPNPATDKINLLFNGQKDQDTKVLITDAVGKVVFQQTYNKEISTTSLDVSSWNRGIYFVNMNGNTSLAKTMSLR